jgi:presenilin-like A22 family membrane protease
MTDRRRIALGVTGAVAFFLAVQGLALRLQGPFAAADYQAVENPGDPANAALYIGVLLVATVGMLALMKYGREGVLRAFILVTSGLISAYVFSVVLPPIVGEPGTLHLGAFLGGGLVVLGLWVHPEWWVIDAAALVMGAGAAALFGISLDVLPVLLLLTALAVYDAISVYGTEHMLTLASGVMELRVPVLIVIPTSRDFSFLEMAAGLTEADEADDADEAGVESEGPLDRDAFFVGLGDVVIPTILAVSATVFLETPTVLGVEYTAVGAIAGTLLGLLVLLYFVTKGRPHAGLPLLNGGAIAGYLVGALAGGLSLLEALGLTPFLG